MILSQKKSLKNILSYSGDSPIAQDGRFNNTNILIHEATFLRIDESVIDHDRANKHSTLEGVLKMVKDTNIQQLILGQFFRLDTIRTKLMRKLNDLFNILASRFLSLEFHLVAV